MRTFDVAERRARLVRRHHLAPGHRAPDVEAASEGLVCLHATDPPTVYLAAWARVDGLTRTDVDKALYADRTLVKHLCMRRTLFVFRRDLLGVTVAAASTRVADQERRRLVKEVEKAGFVDDGAAWLRAAEAATLEALDDYGRGHLDRAARRRRPAAGLDRVRAAQVLRRPRTGGSAGADLPVGGGRDRARLEPRRLDVSRPAWSRTSTWLGEEPAVVPEREARADLVRRWLHAFGPATVADVKWWLGSTVTAVRTALADVGAVDVDLHGEPGVALPDDLDPVESAEPSATLLPALDPTTMGWFGRDWYLGEHRPAIFDSNGNGGTTAWWDGRIVGGWCQAPDGEVLLQLLEDVGAEATAALEREAARLTDWVDGVRVAPRFPSPLARSSPA